MTMTDHARRGVERMVRRWRGTLARWVDRLHNRFAVDESVAVLSRDDLGTLLGLPGRADGEVKNLLDRVTDPIFGVDGQARFTFVNLSARRFFGRESEDLAGESAGAHLVPPLTDFLDGHWRDSDEPGSEAPLRLRPVKPPAGGAPVEALVYPGRDGATVILRAIDEDDRQEEEILDRVRRAEQMVDLRNQMLTMVAHDLRAPIHAVRFHLATLLAFPVSTKRRTEILLAVRRANEAMEGLVQGLLDVQRVEAGMTLPVSMRDANPGELVETACRRLLPELAARKVEVTTRVPTDASDVRVDFDRCVQILRYVVGNAARFTRSPGRIDIWYEEDGDDGRFFVRDFGRGMSEDELARVFEPFWQASPLRSKGGAGLGLYISKLLIEALGGSIQAHSRPGEGTTFRITVPRRSGD